MKIRTILAASLLCLSASAASADIKVSDPAFEKEQAVISQVSAEAATGSSIAELQKIRLLIEEQNFILRKILKEIAGDKK